MRSQTPWRDDPALSFHPDFPDDLQIITHEGEPRRTGRQLELCWARVVALEGVLRFPTVSGIPKGAASLTSSEVDWRERPIYRALLLNQPHQLDLRQGDTLSFLTVPGLPHPLFASAAYLQERPRWAFCPCDRCGSDQGLDPPSVMARTRFPDAGAMEMVAFTAFCGCGGTQMLFALGEEGSG